MYCCGHNDILSTPTFSEYSADATASLIASFSDVKIGLTKIYDYILSPLGKYLVSCMIVLPMENIIATATERITKIPSRLTIFSEITLVSRNIYKPIKGRNRSNPSWVAVLTLLTS